jgi:hypothetical protein
MTRIDLLRGRMARASCRRFRDDAAAASGIACTLVAIGIALAPPVSVFGQAAAPAVLGDRPGDVVNIRPSGLIGPPALLADGRLMIWRVGGPKGKQKAMARFSADHGRTWGDVRTLFSFPGDQGEFMAGSVLVSRSGAIHLFGLDYYSWAGQNARERCKSLLFHARSADNAKTWSAVAKVPFGAAYTGWSNNAVQLRSGRILAPVSLLSNRPTGIWVSVAPYSDDDGLTWHAPVGQVAFNTGATSEDESGAAEPVAVELKDGRVWLLPRSQDGFQWEAFSSDGGLHWTEPRHTRFVSNNSAMAPLRLSDGRLVLLWNNCSDGPVRTFAERAVLAAAISADDGRTWAGYREVARVTAPACVGYPSAAEAGDGRFVVFCGDDYLVKADPDWLTRTSFAEDFSQGIGRWSTLGAEGVGVVADPDGGSGKALRLRKPRASAAAGACLNFPFGARGELTAALRIERGFQGAQVSVEDCYSLPGIGREGCFPLRISAQGRIEIIGSRGSWRATPGELRPGKWHRLRLSWNCRQAQATLLLDDAEIAVIEQYVHAPGIAYLRLRSTAAAADPAGMYVRAVNVAVKPPAD